MYLHSRNIFLCFFSDLHQTKLLPNTKKTAPTTEKKYKCPPLVFTLTPSKVHHSHLPIHWYGWNFVKTAVPLALTTGRIRIVGGVGRREEKGRSMPFRRPSNPNSPSGKNRRFTMMHTVSFLLLGLTQLCKRRFSIRLLYQFWINCLAKKGDIY